MGIFGAVNVSRLGRCLGGREKGMGKSARGKFCTFPTLSRILSGKKKFPSIPAFVNLDLPAQEGFRDTLRGLSCLEFNPEKSLGRGEGWIYP